MNIQREALWSVLLTKYHSGDQIKKNEMDGTYGTCWEQERCIQGLVRILHGRISTGRPRLKWEDNIKVYVQEGMD